jgi:hypothetical protein
LDWKAEDLYPHQPHLLELIWKPDLLRHRQSKHRHQPLPLIGLALLSLFEMSTPYPLAATRRTQKMELSQPIRTLRALLLILQ